MRRAFHLFAAALLVSIVVFLGLRIRSQPTDGDPQAQLIALMDQSGFNHLGLRRISGYETSLSFGRSDCATPVEILYLPAIYHISNNAYARVESFGGTRIFVHDGDRVAGLSAGTLLPRWAWRKLLVAVGIKRARSWQSTALAVLDKGDCILGRIDWQKLT